MSCLTFDKQNNEANKYNELINLYKIVEPTKDAFNEIKRKISFNKQIEKEKQLKNGIYKWILIYTVFYILWISINLAVGLQKNRLMTSKVNNLEITLKDYFVIVGYLQIPLYVFTMFDVVSFNIPAYEREKICDLCLLMLLIERILFLMTHISVMALIFVAIVVSSKLSFSNYEYIGYIIIFLVQLVISAVSILRIGLCVTMHNVIKEVNLYDTTPSDEEVYEEYYNQHI